MKIEELRSTANAMVTKGKGILAMDESSGTCKKRFDKAGIPDNVENRRAYRDLLLTAPRIKGDAPLYILSIKRPPMI